MGYAPSLLLHSPNWNYKIQQVSELICFRPNSDNVTIVIKACLILDAQRAIDCKYVPFPFQRPAMTGDCTSVEALLYSSNIAHVLFCFEIFIFFFLLVAFVDCAFIFMMYPGFRISLFLNPCR